MPDVAIVDDDFMVATTHRRVVESIPDFRVVGVAHTGREAMGLIARTQPELVLLDIYLPDMSGIEIVQQVRTARLDVDFLVLTAARELDTVTAAMQGGVVSYVLKPFRVEELRERLDEYNERKRLLKNHTSVDQAMVDRVIGSPTRSGSSLPKGMSVETAQLIADTLAGRGADISASECATLLGLSRVAARKYLEYFTETGAASVQLRYGQTGRPQRRYAWSRSSAQRE